MDRNSDNRRSRLALDVALRKESVDRNYPPVKPIEIGEVALRKESVDRNLYLSSFALASLVALRKESVDRNVFVYGT